MDIVINCKLLLIHTSEKSTILTNYITDKLSATCHIKFSSTSASHYVFSSKPGSIGFLVFDEYNKEMLSGIKKAQSSFRWSFVIFNNIPETSFRNAQIDIPVGILKILQANSNDEVFELILRIVSYLSDERRMKEQIEFFEREEASLLNRSVSKSILTSMLRDKIGIMNERDLTIILNTYSYKSLLHATVDEFEDMYAAGKLEWSTVERLGVFIQNFNER